LTGTTANEGGIKLTNNSTTDRFALGATNTPLDFGSVVRPVEITARGSNTNYDLRTRGPIAGTGGILKLGPGMFRIDAAGTAHTFTGSLEVREGILRLGSSSTVTNNILPNSTLLVSGGTFDVVDNGSNIQSFPSVTVTKGFLKGGTGTQTASTGSIVRSNSFTFNVAAADTATSDVSIQDSASPASLTKSGTGLAILAGDNFYTGTTTINAGTLQIGNGGTRGSFGTGNIVDNASIVFSRDPASSLTVSNAISGPGSITLAAGQNLTLDGANSYGGATIANAGKLILASSQLNTNALTASGGTIQLAGAAGDIVVKTSAVNASGGGKIDLTDEKIIVSGGSITGITQKIKDGRNGGSWNGTGIITSKTDALGATSKTTVGVATASLAGYGGTKTFEGQTVNASDVLAMYTYSGDANLSGAVDGDDYVQIDAGYSAHSTGWVNGDFDYSGTIDADDYWLIDRTYATQGTPFTPAAPAAGLTAVPEPTAIVALPLLAGLALKRRRRS
jgi:fibronectin-binding autotransporter adhesin